MRKIGGRNGESWVPDGVTSQAVADGYYVLLPPLPVGKHIIAFSSMNGAFSLDVTYNITVKPGSHLE